MSVSEEWAEFVTPEAIERNTGVRPLGQQPHSAGCQFKELGYGGCTCNQVPIPHPLRPPLPLRWIAAEKHAAQADAEREKNRADTALQENAKLRAEAQLAERRYTELHPSSEWHEDIGTVLWWHLPVQEPPYVGAHECMDERDRVGRPTACAQFQRQGWLTHWSYLPNCGGRQ